VPAEIHFHVFFSAHRFFCGLIVFALSYPACKLSTLTSSPWSKSIFILPALLFGLRAPFVLVWIHLVPAQSKRAGQFSIAARIRLATRSAVLLFWVL
jgi:hypothetical protein